MDDRYFTAGLSGSGDPSRRDDPRPPPRAQRWIVGVMVVLFGVAGTGLAAATDRLDSALLFVALPCVLALMIGLLPTRNDWGMLFQALTVVLLLCSALLHEGALCVLIASPLVYGFGGLVLWITRSATRDHPGGHRLLALPALALMAVSLEGAVPGLRVSPEQDARAQRIVAADCATFEAALDRGPRFRPEDRGILLRLAKYPTPSAATSPDGLRPGSTWRLSMPDGVITSTVTMAERDLGTGGGQLAFEVTDDTARTSRWVTLRAGHISWRGTPEGCLATLTIDYRRHLDPAFWFGPVSEVFMNAGADTFLAALD